jgi:hypothetical protein
LKDWSLLEEQITDWLEGIGAGEDAEDIKRAFSTLGLSPQAIEKMLNALKPLKVHILGLETDQNEVIAYLIGAAGHKVEMHVRNKISIPEGYCVPLYYKKR